MEAERHADVVKDGLRGCLFHYPRHPRVMNPSERDFHFHVAVLRLGLVVVAGEGVGDGDLRVVVAEDAAALLVAARMLDDSFAASSKGP